MDEENSKNKKLLKEIWDYLRVRKAYWLLPIIVMILLTGYFIYYQSVTSGFSYFIYVLF